MYRCADRSRTIELVDTLCTSGVSTAVFACGFRAAVSEIWRDPAERSRKQADGAGVRIITDIDRKLFEVG